MSSLALNVKPEEIDSAEKREKYTISIIGCGQIGILHAVLFADAGFKVTCVDADQTVVNNISKGKVPLLRNELEAKIRNHLKKGRLNTTNDVKKAVSQSSVIVLTVSAKVDRKKKIDYTNIENICKRIGSSLQCGSLIIVGKATGIGITEDLIKGTIENASGLKAGTEFGLAYSPIIIQEGPTLEKVTGNKRVVAAIDKNSLNAASAILQTITRSGLKKTANIKTAEVATLLESLQQDVNVAVTNELALFCEKAGVNYSEAYKLLETQNGSLLPTPSLTEETMQEEPYLLLTDAENLSVKLKIPSAAREINEDIIKHIVNLTKDALRTCGKTMRRARISLLGISQTPNGRGPPKKIVKEIAELLESRGARVSLHDPYFSEKEISEMQSHAKKNFTEFIEGADCLILLTPHDQFKRLNPHRLKMMMKMPAAIVDFAGIIDPEKVEKEGFTYRGFGNGVWTR